MIQTTVSIALDKIRISNMLNVVNEKNSMVSNITRNVNTQTIVYFRKDDTPIVIKEGTMLSSISRGVNQRRNSRRVKASRSAEHTSDIQ